MKFERVVLFEFMLSMFVILFEFEVIEIFVVGRGLDVGLFVLIEIVVKFNFVFVFVVLWLSWMLWESVVDWFWNLI